MSLFNKGKENCIKTSSTCMLWFGGKVCSISVCEGDTIEDIVKKLGKSIYSLEQVLDINNLDFSDLLAEKECPPKDIKDLIQLILNKIQECCGTSETVSAVEVTVTPASCFVGELGEDPISVQAYVEFLGETACSQQQEIANLRESIVQLRNTVIDLSEQVQTLIGG